MTQIDYDLVNYCTTCRTKVPKDQTRCTDCNWLVRTKPIKTDETKVFRY